MRIRMYNGRILTMEKENGQLKEWFFGEVWIKEHEIENVICYDSHKKELVEEVFDKEIDVKGNLLMPGFKNAHAHAPMTFLRSYADDVSLHQWLYEKVFPMEARLLPEDMKWLSKLAIMEYVTSGITSSFEMYLNLDMLAQAAIETGFRMVLCGPINSQFGTAKEAVSKLKDWYDKYSGGKYNDLVSMQLGFHAEYTTPKEMLEEIAILAREKKAPVYTHNSETKGEVLECINRYQMTPTKYFDSIGMFEYGGGGFHCNYLTEEDMDIFKEKGLYAITNPASNVKLASGIAPLTRMREKGISLAIGTDGAASNNCLDIFKEMFLVTGLQKIATEKAEAMDSDIVLEMATIKGAEAMGLENCKTISKGQLADIIVLDLQQPNMQPIHNIKKNIVYSGSKQNVLLTMVNGKILYHNGKFFIGIEKEEVYEMANKIAKRCQL